MHHGDFELSLTYIRYDAIWLTMSTFVPCRYSGLQTRRNSVVSQQASFRERAFNMAQATSGEYVLSR